MSSVNKRHQARNERALQELLTTVPGNDRCADCQARNPGWASWSLGIFLCVRCASLHRKLGTHISKVKSLSMDSWAADQVENMRRIGNVNSNQKFNPSNTKPPVPLDADEIDAAMERFIRAKYEQKAYVAGAPPPRSQTLPPKPQQPPQPRPVEYEAEREDPPTPPPKSGRKFGLSFRSATFGKGKVKTDFGPETATAPTGKVIGAAFGVRDEGMEWKLVTLKEMGFPDERRNSSILKGVNGDLDRAIESLVRLGEGTGAVRRQAVPAQQSGGTSKPYFPQRAKEEPGFGIQVQSPVSAPSKSLNQPSLPAASQEQDIWDTIPPAASSASSPKPLDAAFQNLQLSQGPQAALPHLFPHSTGGTPQSNPPPGMQPPYQHSMTPPVPQMPQQFVNNPYSPTATRNPFMTSPVQQSPIGSSNPFMNMQQDPASSNPFLAQAPAVNGAAFAPSPQSQPMFQQPALQQAPPQQWASPQQGMPSAYGMQQPFATPPLATPPQSQSPQVGWNPYLQYPQQPAQQVQPQQQLQQQQFFGQPAQPMMPQATGRFDKTGIMALYNYPQLAPQPTSPLPQANGGTPEPQPVQSPLGITPVQRSVTMPVSASKNPFAVAQPPPAIGAGYGGADDSGRHSPDAFANLSARFVR